MDLRDVGGMQVQGILPAIGRAVNSWKPKKYFSYFFFSLRYLSSAIGNVIKVTVPLSITGILWAIKTGIKLAILFFALIILLLGPRIGLPRAMYQVMHTLFEFLRLLRSHFPYAAARIVFTEMRCGRRHGASWFNWDWSAHKTSCEPAETLQQQHPPPQNSLL
jgi:hypothetical protein